MADDGAFGLDDFLPYLLAQAAETAGRSFAEIYRDRYGMLNTEWRVLAHLGQDGPLTATRIGTLARVHKTKISRAVAALEQKRFISRETSAADRRSATLHLTRQGRAAYADLTRIARAYDEGLAALLGGQGRARLVAQLRRLSKG